MGQGEQTDMEASKAFCVEGARNCAHQTTNINKKNRLMSMGGIPALPT
jgi:hypothetical protein